MSSDQFVSIPETTLPGGSVVPAFQVMQYPASTLDGKPVSTREGKPWVRISYHGAVKAAESAGYKLERESQRLAVAYHIAAQPANWMGGKVGEGKLFQGLRKGNANGVQDAAYESNDPDERRWFALPGDQVIYDIAGNVWQWVFDDVQGDSRGLIGKPFAADSASLVIPFPDKQMGQGWTPNVGANWSGLALIRGGCWLSERDAGVFHLYNDWPGLEYDLIGFRCTK
ncbi:MAG: hypothetical protein JWN23_621 [Rhodocyclales bacterium]|nr:hypothetical protein [Rhodocyclales bacterium]